MPQVTEAWGVAYLQVLVVLFVFSFGMPALAFQLAVPEDVRGAARHLTRSALLMSLVVAFVLVLLAAAFIWLLHPCTTALPRSGALLAGLTVSASFLIALVFWWTSSVRLFRAAGVRTLKKRVWKIFRNKGIVDEDGVDCLAALGSRSQPGYEKGLVLDALEELANGVQSDAAYTGAELGPLTRALSTVLVADDRSGPSKEGNYISAARTLIGVLSASSSQGLRSVSDRNSAAASLRRLATSAARAQLDSAALIALEGASDNPSLLSDIGIAALESERHLVSAAALAKLQAVAAVKTPISSDTVAPHILGFVARLWVTRPSTKRLADTFLKRNEDRFFPSLVSEIESAREYHYVNLNYAIAEALESLLAGLEGTDCDE